ncbi:unnamed protein product [Rangifer tarandus platyrhynchus]|uniref:Uncharacterized protein n=2 Tax=Rangifer tarandus platyrhynchus TaxID=3082113 RepID=A0ACB0F741_RANTA|nr:unnamed protein product [Rangifer tarandus platyrhynchus]CAI9708318.1 unnamed protein product [Rangifer tarandus platyrhynchus]
MNTSTSRCTPPHPPAGPALLRSRLQAARSSARLPATAALLPICVGAALPVPSPRPHPELWGSSYHGPPRPALSPPPGPHPIRIAVRQHPIPHTVAQHGCKQHSHRVGTGAAESGTQPELWFSQLRPLGTCPTPSRERPPLGMRTSSQGDTSLSNITLPGRPRPSSPGQLPQAPPGVRHRLLQLQAEVTRHVCLSARPPKSPPQRTDNPPTKQEAGSPSRIDCKLTSSSRKRLILQKQAVTHTCPRDARHPRHSDGPAFTFLVTFGISCIHIPRDIWKFLHSHSSRPSRSNGVGSLRSLLAGRRFQRCSSLCLFKTEIHSNFEIFHQGIMMQLELRQPAKVRRLSRLQGRGRFRQDVSEAGLRTALHPFATCAKAGSPAGKPSLPPGGECVRPNHTTSLQGCWSLMFGGAGAVGPSRRCVTGVSAEQTGVTPSRPGHRVLEVTGGAVRKAAWTAEPVGWAPGSGLTGTLCVWFQSEKTADSPRAVVKL